MSSNCPCHSLPPAVDGPLRPGEEAALRAADRHGWIEPPVYDCLVAVRPRTWGSADVARLRFRGLVSERRVRHDSVSVYRLNDAGMAARSALHG